LTQSLIALGADLILVGRRADALAETLALSGAGSAIAVAADITTPEGRQSVQQQVAIKGRLDLLVNNAGMVPVGPLSDLSDSALQQVLALNVAAPASLTRDLLPFLRRSPQARVVNLGSMFGDIAFPYFAAYSASKFALRGLSDALRRELAEDGIAVTYVAPRATQTPAAQGFAHLVGPFAMQLDSPQAVAAHILHGVGRQKAVIYPRGLERLFVLLQRLVPGPIDAALKRQLAAYRAQA
jgi:short-subunit dehydrogenase